jgi:hypothetical protein
MLTKVKQFNTPTEDHTNYKKFMEDQIVESMKFDCDVEYDRKRLVECENGTFEGYMKAKEKSLKWNVNYHSEEMVKQNERTDGRWKWVESALKAIEEVED